MDRVLVIKGDVASHKEIMKKEAKKNGAHPSLS
jgi:hypothetical protein